MKNVCRTCLRAPTKLLSIHSDKGLTYKIESIASIQLLEDDDFPSTICEECVANINKLYNFRKVIINSDKDLRERHETLLRLVKSKPESNEKIEIECHDVDQVKLEEHDPSVPKDKQFNSGQFLGNLECLDLSLETARSLLPTYNCNMCEQKFFSRIRLNNHKRTRHVKPGVCNICGLVVRADNLGKHVANHSEDPVQCQDCGKVYKNMESLRGHTYIHKGHIFTCGTCGREFKVRAEYQRHMKNHADPDRGKAMCPVCGKKIKGLRQHMHTHTGERPYVCIYCNKGLSSTHALKVHIRQHTKERPYNCEHCSMAFPQKVSLATHLKSKHSDIL